MEQAWLSWSSGKDSALALHELRASGDREVTGLVTTLDVEADRVAMHGVRRALVEAQADALGLPLHLVELPWPCPNEVYEQRMSPALAAAKDSGARLLAFGDLYLADIRAYREQSLAGTGLTAVFPLWERPTTELAGQVLRSGIRAVITCVDPRQAPRELAGRWYDRTLVDGLPPGVDPCGENGEFHTFVVDGPDFAHPLDVRVGDITDRDGFVYADVLPA
ncbi:adenine nucleotide alpha hydrolase [Pseudonocardia spinosispora]|uniref:adenine nucleotide alpha hydrolase n=1 Tax=Pseudonocardia spinosispora TaxID=103441 RepID=UPI000407EF17|nr:adenine nucleotide alpha hydrolase [Pseudonocardia spinosispora]